MTDDSTTTSLVIRLRNHGIDTLINDSEGRHFASVDVDPAITVPTKILEEAVYARPDLLANFDSVTVIADSSSFALVPGSLIAADGSMARLAEALWQEHHPSDVNAETICAGVAVMNRFDHALAGFVQRTFTGATLRHRMAALCDFFSRLSRPVNSLKLYANFNGDNGLDIVVFNAEGPVLANTFTCTDPTDELYFIMAAVKDSGLDPLDDEVVVCGNPDRRTAALAPLRKYLNSVMPLLLPLDDSQIPIELL